MSDCLILNGDYQPLSLLPLSVVGWQQAVKLYFLDRVRIIEVYDDWQVHSPSMNLDVPALVALKEYHNLKKHVKFSRANMLLRDMYQCQYCADTFRVADLTIDHVVPISKGGKTNWENCVSACRKCNTSKGDKVGYMRPIREPYRPDYYNLSSLRKERPFNIRHSSWLPYIGDVEKFKFQKDFHQ